MIHKVGVISDTHGLLRQEVRETLAGCEAIFHAGDIGRPSVLDALRQIAGLTAVRGNADKDWAESLPEEILTELFGLKVYMVHDQKKMTALADGADIRIFGHSHKYLEKRDGDRLLLNPGSCGARRFGGPVTMAVLTIDDEAGTAAAEKIVLSGDGKEEAAMRAGGVETAGRRTDGGGTGRERKRSLDGGADMRRVVELVTRDMRRGRTVEQMVERHGIKRELAEQICQIYATHPGIDVQGILDRMEIAGL